MAAQHGNATEEYFKILCETEGLKVDHIDSWYDFEIEGHRVEVKSCRLAVATGRAEEKKLSQGRYDFTKKYNRKTQYQENVWVCFIIRCRDQFLIQGFTKSRDLQQKRYISIVNAESYHLKSFQQFKNIITNKTKSL